MADPVFFNPLQDGYMENPWPHFAEMRQHEPVHYSITENWFLFDYADVTALLRDPSMSVDDANLLVHNEERLAAFEEAFGPDAERSTSMLSRDAPDHTRLRRLVSKAFTPSTIAALRPMIQELVDTALDAMDQRGTAEVVGELAFPLPFDVIQQMLGMPDADKEQVAGWSAAIVKTLDPIISDDEVQAAAKASKNMDALLDDVIEWKRANPADDLLTALIEAEEDGDRLSPRELRDQVSLLFVAGHETTVNLIGTGLYEMLQHPDQAAILRDDPSVEVNAIDELLRFVAPVQISRRVTLDDIEIRGHKIAKGTGVMTVLASANRDPAKWGDDAEELDVRRPGVGQHTSFGGGSHYCLGASLARLEAQVAIGSFLRRFPDATIAGEPEWNGRINLRGLDKLDVAVR